MDLSSLQMLLTPLGQTALTEAAALEPQETKFLQDHTLLSRKYPAGLSRAALEIAILRKEAAVKFPFADRMYFTRQALEQASSHVISAYRASLFRSFELVFDLACSIGSDTVGLAAETNVVGVDIDPLRLVMAQQNILALGFQGRAEILQADLSAPLPFAIESSQAFFFDPGRRQAGRRSYSVFGYQPPLNIIDRWITQTPAAGVKISPGVDLNEVQSFDAEIEFISVQGELKEAVLWFGPLKTAVRRATLLPGGQSMRDEGGISQSGQKSSSEFPVQISEPRAYLYEPDPAVLRAGLVRQLGAHFVAFQLVPVIAYLTADRWIETPFARCYRVDEWIPFNLKRLKNLLRQKGVESATVKKRGSPIAPERLLHDLGLRPGSGNSPDECLIMMTHLRGKPIAILCAHVEGFTSPGNSQPDNLPR